MGCDLHACTHLLTINFTLFIQVKDCYLVHLVEELHDTQNETIILFTHTCRSVNHSISYLIQIA